ncbi:hypothetical protein B0H19DRAFT_1333443 [Mycena capillaripes]|nr:hypothetical protein B0H19DRAFT_1333443 [Mycena capillaripes]
MLEEDRLRREEDRLRQEEEDRLRREEGAYPRLPKKKGNPGSPTVFSDHFVVRLKGATLLLLPTYFSTPNLVTSTSFLRLRKNVAHFTIAKSLEEATSNPDYERIQEQVQQEWLKVGGAVRDLSISCFLETAAFALAPGSLFSVDKVARIMVSRSSISTGAGLLCDTYLILRFSFASGPVFKNGSISRTGSYLFFALIARLPLFLTVISILFIAALLVDVACKISPPVVWAILSLTGIILYLQYICWVLIWMVFGVLKVLSWLGGGLSKAGTWLTSAFKYVVGKTRGF